MFKKPLKSTGEKKRLVNKISLLSKFFRKNNPKKTSLNYNEMVSNFEQKIKNRS